MSIMPAHYECIMVLLDLRYLAISTHNSPVVITHFTYSVVQYVDLKLAL
jgi:hypothetical protein